MSAPDVPDIRRSEPGDAADAWRAVLTLHGDDDDDDAGWDDVDDDVDKHGVDKRGLAAGRPRGVRRR
ncbi:hypothetical protein [Pseudonocardia sp. GCM10023141]|uniref:hypothetical protein n=1 Tax=Pseudonocardia sp. GCM10023141 TaxID=3252653 RepID=UPI00361814C1